MSKISISSEQLRRRRRRWPQARNKWLLDILRPKNWNLFLFFILEHETLNQSYKTTLKKTFNKLQRFLPVQNFYRDLAEIGEISPRSARSRRDWGDLAEIAEISPRSQGGLEALPMIPRVKAQASFHRYKQNLVIIFKVIRRFSLGCYFDLVHCCDLKAGCIFCSCF